MKYAADTSVSTERSYLTGAMPPLLSSPTE